MQLEISTQERDLMQRILSNALSEMRVEVRRTSTPRYHDALRADEELLRQLVARIEALAP